jgi:hypothetical protein
LGARLVGLTPVAVTPHVFAVDGAAVRYGGFTRRSGRLSLEHLAEAELPAETFLAGPLGGPLRGREAFDQALDAVMAQLPAAPAEASLVVPDRWLRLLFTELEDELGASPAEDVLRFKLKKLVPFRVEELRLRATVVPALTRDAGPRHRLLLAFAVEQLVADLEAAFAARGIRLGQLASRSLYLISLLREREDRGLLFANLEADGYSLCYLDGGMPVVMRYRTLPVDPGDPTEAAHVAQDLRILLAFLEEQRPGHAVGEVLLCGAPTATAAWAALLYDRFELPARALGARDLPLDPPAGGAAGAGPGGGWHQVAPLAAAASREVA